MRFPPHIVECLEVLQRRYKAIAGEIKFDSLLDDNLVDDEIDEELIFFRNMDFSKDLSHSEIENLLFSLECIDIVMGDSIYLNDKKDYCHQYKKVIAIMVKDADEIWQYINDKKKIEEG